MKAKWLKFRNSDAWDWTRTVLQIAVFILGIIATIAAVKAIWAFLLSTAHADEMETAFTLYGIEYTVEEQVIALQPDEIEEKFDEYVEYDPEIVTAIQQALRNKGYKLSVDGKFGPKTGNAVKMFQRKKKLKIDGIVGPKTLEALGLPDYGIYPRYTPDLRAALDKSPVGKLVHLNLGSHLVEAYIAEGDNIRLLRIMLAATGNVNKGYYTNLCNVQLNRTPNPGGRISDDNWRGEYAVPITAGDYFHSVLAHKKNGKWVLDDNSVLGTNASHGCVRLAVEDAFWLQNFCEKGTAIVVDDRNWDFRGCILP